jgi:hypothetical protein
VIDAKAYNPKVMNQLKNLIQEKIRYKCTGIYDDYGVDDIDNIKIMKNNDTSFVVVDLGMNTYVYI